MKVRNGFVSNSSSSSFIVALDKEATVTISFRVNLAKYAKTKITTPEELISYFKDEFSYNSEYRDKIFVKMMELINSGKVILSGYFEDQSGDEIEELLCNIGIPTDTKGITIIENEPGY